MKSRKRDLQWLSLSLMPIVAVFFVGIVFSNLDNYLLTNNMNFNVMMVLLSAYGFYRFLKSKRSDS